MYECTHEMRCCFHIFLLTGNSAIITGWKVNVTREICQEKGSEITAKDHQYWS